MARPHAPAPHADRWATALAKAAALQPAIIYDPATDTWFVCGAGNHWYALTSTAAREVRCSCGAGLNDLPCYHAGALYLELGVEPPQEDPCTPPPA